MKLKGIYSVYDKEEERDLFLFAEANNNRAIATAIRTVGQMVNYKETELFKVGEFDPKLNKVVPIEKVIKINYEDYTAENKAENKPIEEIEEKVKENVRNGNEA